MHTNTEPDIARLNAIAAVAHDANRRWCLANGDTSQPLWEDAPDWQRASALDGVRKIAAGEVTRPEQSHESWLAHKSADGWVYGPEKDPVAKQHPCMVPYADLPPEQRAKDALYFGIVTALLEAHG
jgi:hypothetical protein